MSSKDKILNKIRQHSKELKTYGAKRVGLFGSFARASQKTKSDMDILIEFNRGSKTLDNYMDIKFFLEKLFQRKVDLVIKDALKKRIKSRILSEVNYA